MILIGLSLVLSVPASDAACPVGSYPWVDNWGNHICKSFETGQPQSSEGSLVRCPVGSYPWVDQWGTKICQSFDNGQRYYDTSRGCPTGSYPWTDSWGNKICKFF